MAIANDTEFVFEIVVEHTKTTIVLGNNQLDVHPNSRLTSLSKNYYQRDVLNLDVPRPLWVAFGKVDGLAQLIVSFYQRTENRTLRGTAELDDLIRILKFLEVEFTIADLMTIDFPSDDTGVTGVDTNYGTSTLFSFFNYYSLSPIINTYPLPSCTTINIIQGRELRARIYCTERRQMEQAVVWLKADMLVRDSSYTCIVL
jgi:hypothetical protein